MPEEKIFWVASYPRSGNLWVSHVLHALLYGADAPSAVSPRVLVADLCHPSVLANLPHGGGPNASLTAALTNANLPFQMVPLRGEPVLLAKTHYPWSPQMPCASKTVGAIYLVRNLIDVLISEVKFLCYTSPETLHKGEKHLAWFIDDLIDYVACYGGSKSDIELGFGSWPHHIASWTTLDIPFPVLLVRYEDLLHIPDATLERVSSFLEISADRERIGWAVAKTRREQMKKEQEAQVADKAGYFYNTGDQKCIDKGYRYILDNQDFSFAHLIKRSRFKRAMRRYGRIFQELGYD